MKMKKTSKIMALVVAVAMVLCLMPVMMVSAASFNTAIGDGITEVTAPKPTATDTVVNFTVKYQMTATTSDQVTLLVTMGSEAITYDANNQPTNIAYIDQVAYSATGTFTFVADKPAAGTTTNYYVKVGGTDITQPASNASSPAVVVVDSLGFTVSGLVTPVSTINDATEDAKVQVTATLKDSNGATVATTIATPSTGAYSFSNVANGNYTVELSRANALKKNPIPVAVAGSAATVPTTQLYNGDVNGDGYIDIGDAYLVMPFLETYPGDGVYDPKYDINLDGYVDIGDAYLIMPQLEFYDNID